MVSGDPHPKEDGGFRIWVLTLSTCERCAGVSRCVARRCGLWRRSLLLMAERTHETVLEERRGGFLLPAAVKETLLAARDLWQPEEVDVLGVPEDDRDEVWEVWKAVLEEAAGAASWKIRR